MKLLYWKYIRGVAPLILVLAAVLAAAWPLFGTRFIPTHDGEYHIIRFWQFYTALAGGAWFPRWAPDLNNGFGIPLFTFVYPFPNYIGSIFHTIGFSFVASVRLTMAAAYITAAFFCFLWLRRVFGPGAAAAGTITGVFVPYWFLDLYIRGSVGEVWALAWVFAALFGIASGRRTAVALAAALLILSHNIMAMVFMPVLFFYCLMVNRAVVWGLAAGIGISSYFWLPALYEQRYIAGLSPVNILDHFPDLSQLLIPSWGSGFRGQVTGGSEMSYQIGLVPLVLAVIVFFMMLRQKMHRSRESVFALVLFLSASVFMLPWTAPVWRIVPLAQNIQYPWRLLSVIAVATPVLAAVVSRRTRFFWLIPVCAVLFALRYAQPVTYEPRNDKYYLSQPSFTRGTNSMGDAFRTVWASDIPETEGGYPWVAGSIVSHSAKPGSHDLVVRADGASLLTLPVSFYPGWFVRVDGREVAPRPDERGLLAIPLESGEHRVQVRLGATWWQVLSLWVSIFSLSAVSASFILKTYAYRHKHTSP